MDLKKSRVKTEESVASFSGHNGGRTRIRSAVYRLEKQATGWQVQRWGKEVKEKKSLMSPEPYITGIFVSSSMKWGKEGNYVSG